MRKGQPLKLQPCMLTDSKWMRVFNSIVSNITMIPNSGNRSKFGIDILNKQDRKALAFSNEREPVKIRPDSWNSIPWNCTQTPKQDEEKYHSSSLQFFQPAHVHICDKNNPISPNPSARSTNNPWFFWLPCGGLSEQVIALNTQLCCAQFHPLEVLIQLTKLSPVQRKPNFDFLSESPFLIVCNKAP